MGLDIRLPIGILFTLLGVLLVAYGIVSDPAIYQRALGVNLNLYWGAVVLVFGVAMLALALRQRKRTMANGTANAPTRGNSP